MVFQKQKKDTTLRRILSYKYLIKSSFEQSLDLFYRRTERFIRFDLIPYRLAGMQNSCMVTLSDDLPDIRERTVGILLRQVHRNLTCLHNFPLARVGLDNGQFQVIVFTDYILNRFHRHLLLFQFHDTAHHLLSQRQVNHPVESRRISQ